MEQELLQQIADYLQFIKFLGFVISLEIAAIIGLILAIDKDRQ